MSNLHVVGPRPLRIGLLLAAVFQSLLSGQQPEGPPIDHSKEAVVVEQSRSLYRFEDDGTGRRETQVRLRIQSEAGVQQFGQLVFGYNAANERPEITFVRVRKPDGTIVETPPDGVQDLSAPVQSVASVYTDFRQKHVTVQGLRPADVLEFSLATSLHTPQAPGQFWAEYDFNDTAIVLDEQLEIDVPAARVVTLKTRPGFEPSTRDSGGRRIYRWSRANLKRREEEKKDGDAEPKEPPPAAVRLTTFQTWEQVGRWYASLEGPQRVPTAEIRKKAAELVAGRTTELAKLEALYEFVGTSFRYVSLSLGAGRYQPRSAADVLREQYGDCKDKHTLLASLLDAVGMKSAAVLIHTTAKLDPSFPSPSQFDHVVTRAIADGQEIWVDTTAEVAPFRLLMLPLRNKQALVTDAGEGPRLTTTPANPPMRSFVRQAVNGTLLEDGRLDARVTFGFRGDTEILMRTLFRSTPAAQWKEVLDGFVKGYGVAGEISDWKISDPAALRDPFTIEFTIAVNAFANWTSKRITVPLPFSGDAMGGGVDEDESEALSLGAAPSEVLYTLRLQLPPDVTARAPLPVSISRDYAEYRAAYDSAGSVVAAERLMTVRLSELPAARRQDYAAFARVLSADYKQTLALETTAVPSAVSRDAGSDDLARQAAEALKAGDFARATTLLKRVLELDPKHKTAWTDLGRALMAQRERNAAVAAFNKQIELNPYDPQAYSYLGYAYMEMRRFDEAEAAYKKQLEVNPLDQIAHSGLGQLYLERRQYEPAAVHLEKAIALMPENAWLHASKGKAQLRLGREAEALASFDKAVSLSATPTMWNDIAYELALRNTQLDRAQQYAESAVAATAAASRNLDIGRVDDQALGIVQSLVAYWDTLGWVAFARGDMARAERYVEPAWRLGQHAEVGDHLAQIYERTGRREEAIRTYALALAAEGPSDDVRQRLARLIGQDKVDAAVAQHREELAKQRTVSIPGEGVPGKTADFVVLQSSSSAVEAVRFAGGDEALRGFGEAIRKTSLAVPFPDDTPAKILRRGILACSSGGTCTFTLLLTDDAQPLK
jgi:tetratricopeptide (TPR) repeat protein